MAEREVLEVDVLFVGAGPAGLGGAIRLAQLAKASGRAVNIAVLDKAREIGAHTLSGAVMDPKSLRELFPDFESQGAPIESPVEEDYVWFLTRDECAALPFTPPSLRNHGHLIVSLAQLVRWLGRQAEALGVNLFPGFAAVEPLIEEGRVVGVRTGDKGVDRRGQRKPNFEPGVDLRAKVTVVSEGPRGSLTRLLVERFRLDEGRQPQVYAAGVKEIWELPAGTVPRGRVIHTMGWPLRNDQFGGGFIYSMSRDRLDIGFVVGLDYKDPFTDSHHEFQRFKTHPKIRSMLEGGRLVEYGAKTIPEGGWYSVPRLHMPGALLAGDGAGLLDPQRLKGVHLALKSGMLAAETAFEALEKGDFSDRTLASYGARIEGSFIRRELWKSRHFKKGFKYGFAAGLLGAAFAEVSGGWSPFAGVRLAPGHTRMQTIERYHGTPQARPARIAFDDRLTFSKLSDLYVSGTMHEEDQPCHLLVLEPDLCVSRCVREYGNPCQHFCPAAVYEWVRKDEKDVGRLQINASNCVHCKTCDIMDPYGIIRWVPPEGGGGPSYQNL
ncbi:MAG TPA: electron transfer flavoprotein-ubiquinone oxidoreductase [Planctomycetota bacterium]|nr:electron transfer flavoprotein-ubiquinone oxidoreductase [Planctomycetota bacterium]